ncbi:MAG: TMEM175 family protein, partial [Pseudomonadota bacterium]|nr:TMEM175 family protein [Pseudomonadota bacterium]
RGERMTDRLDNFTDAAFAFAVSLLVIGGARAPEDFAALILSLGDIPASAFGFAIMAMFWLGHVRWRKLRGDGDSLAVLLTLPLTILWFSHRHDWTGDDPEAEPA